MDFDDDDAGGDLVAAVRGKFSDAAESKSASTIHLGDSVKFAVPVDDDNEDDEGEGDSAEEPKSIDLNDPEALARAELDDPRLRMRIQNARDTLADIERQTKDLPDVKQLQKTHTANLKTLSSSFSEFGKRLGEYQTAVENTLVQSSNAGKLAIGGSPYGFSEAKDSTAQFQLLSKKLAENGQAHQELHTQLGEILRKLTVARRDYESVVDGYIHIAEDANRRAVAAKITLSKSSNEPLLAVGGGP